MANITEEISNLVDENEGLHISLSWWRAAAIVGLALTAINGGCLLWLHHIGTI